MSFEVKSVTHRIIDGPDKSTIFAAMEYCYEAKIPLEFMIATGYSKPENGRSVTTTPLDTKNMDVHLIQHEDGSGHNFNLEGFIDVRFKPNANYVARRYKAFYSTRTHTGHITLEKI